MSQATELPLSTTRAWSNLVVAKRVRAKSNAHVWGPFFAIMVALIWSSSLIVGFGTAVAMIAALGFAGALLGFRWPGLGLFSVGILAGHDNLIRVCLADGSTFFRENTFNYFLLLTVLIYGYRLFSRRDPHTWWLMGIIALLTVELYMSPGMRYGVPHVMNSIAGLGFILIFLRGVKDEAVWYWLAVVMGTGAAMGGAIYFLQKSSIDELMHFDRNGVAYFFLSGIFSICLGFRFASQHKYGTVILGTLAAFCGCWVFLTASRGGMLICATAFACLMTEIKGMNNRMMVLVVGGLVAMGVLAKFAEEQLASAARWNKLMDENRSLASRTSGRSDLYRGGLMIFAANPLGVGTGSFGLAYKEISRNEGEFTFGVDHEASAHSAWLKLLAENGAPGVLLLAGYVFSFVFVGWQKWREGLFLLGLLASVALGVSFLSSEFQGKGLWFLAAGITVLLHLKRPITGHTAGKAKRGL
jgi:O-antigen ligase